MAHIQAIPVVRISFSLRGLSTTTLARFYLRSRVHKVPCPFPVTSRFLILTIVANDRQTKKPREITGVGRHAKIVPPHTAFE